jgi:NADH dehydrogenase
MNSTQSPHIVIIGCGFGGLEAAKALRKAPVRITLIDRTNHHLFQPLLYQVATAGLAAPAIAAPIRHVFRHQQNLTTLLGEVVGIDAVGKHVSLRDAQRVPFDHLIVATGAAHSYFGQDQWAAHAPGLKTLADAFDIRRRLLMAFERAECAATDAERDAWLTFAVVGAGPTGVELAGTLAEIARHALAGEFRHIAPQNARVLLIEGGPRVLQAMPESLSASALKQLQNLGVETQLQTKVLAISEFGVEVQTAAGATTGMACKTVLWAAGVKASPLGKVLADSTGAELDRAGRVKVAADLSLSGFSHISVIGDLAAALSHASGQEPKPVPGVSPAAKQMGKLAAANVLRRIQGQATQAFRYRDYGNLATIGRHSAVVDLATPLGPLRFSGFLAWVFWLFAHVYFLIGFRNRLVVLLDWAWAYFTYQRNARVVADVAEKSKE